MNYKKRLNLFLVFITAVVLMFSVIDIESAKAVDYTNIVAISSSDHTLAVTSDGKLLAWGANDKGQLGLGYESDYVETPTIVPDISNVKKVFTGKGTSFIELQDGTVMACGDNSYGQLALGTFDGTIQYNKFQKTASTIYGASKIELGDNFGIALVLNNPSTEGGSAYAWGNNDRGQLGIPFLLGKFTAQPTSVDLSSISGDHIVYDVAVKGKHSIFNVAQNAYVCGDNSLNQLGDSSIGDKADSLIKINGLGSVYKVYAGYDFNVVVAVVVTPDNSKFKVYTFGNNDKGQLGLGDINNHEGVNLIDLSVIPDKIFVGNKFVLLGDTDGNSYTWGENDKGQLGLGIDNSYVDTPTLGYIYNADLQGTAGYDYVALIYKGLENNVIVYGDNTGGKLGAGLSSSIVNLPYFLDGTQMTIEAKSFSLDKTSIDLNVGDTEQIQYTLSPSVATNAEITWASDDNSIATVSKTGLIKAVAGGTTHIKGYLLNSNVEQTLTVNVVGKKAVPIQGISIGVSSIQLVKGASTKIQYSLIPSDTTDTDVEWSSDNTDVATVTADGTVYGVSAGVANITVKDLNYLASVQVKVLESGSSINVSEVELNSNIVDLDLANNKTFQLIALIKPETATNKSVIWQSTDPLVASVNRDGLVTAISPGKAYVIVKTEDGGHTASAEVNVKDSDNGNVLVRNLILGNTSLEVQVGQTQKVDYAVLPTSATNQVLKWVSSDERIFTVDNTGIITGVALGSATLTVSTTDGSNITKTAKVTVSPVPVSSIAINSPNGTVLKTGESVQLQAVVSPSNASNSNIVWSSNNKNIAVVDSKGKVTAIGVGKVTIVATDKNYNVSESIVLEVQYLEDYWQTKLTINNAREDEAFIVKFTQAIDPTTIDNIFLATDSSGNSKLNDVSIKLDSDKRTVKISLNSGDWAQGQTYYLFIDRGIKSATGQALGKTECIVFNIRH